MTRRAPAWTALACLAAATVSGIVRAEDPSAAAPDSAAQAKAHALAALAGKGDPARAAFREALHDPAAPVRAAAAGLLAREAGEAAIPDLAPLVDDTDENVAVAAARALIPMKGEAAAEAVRKALRSPSLRVRSQTAGYVGDAKDGRFVREVGALVSDASPAVRQTAVESLRAVNSAEAFPSLMAATGDAQPAVVSVALSALEQLGDPRACERIARLAQSPSAEIRVAAAGTLAALGGASRQPDAMKSLLGDPSTAVRMAVVAGLKRHPSPEGVPLLLGRLEDKDAGVRRLALSALRTSDAPGTAEAVRARLKDSDAGVRAAAALDVVERGGEAAWPALESVAGDPSVDVRAVVVEGAGRLKVPAALPTLERYVRDSDVGLRGRAAWAAGEIGGDGALKILDLAFADKDAGVKSAAVRAWGGMRTEASLKKLRGAAKAGPAALRVAALQEIATAKDAGAAEVVKACLQDPSEAVRAAARRAQDAIAKKP